ncbi:MAG: helix-turn-helix domain-containing protein [Phascolarctobacterium sp.]|nr:helix-turn-helix domain-containing protein [Phascolarctobacterium sp.]
MEIGVKIRNIRQQSLLSQQDFAQILGVSFCTVNRWETGKTKPAYRALKTLNEFCRANNIEFNVIKELMEENK